MECAEQKLDNAMHMVAARCFQATALPPVSARAYNWAQVMFAGKQDKIQTTINNAEANTQNQPDILRSVSLNSRNHNTQTHKHTNTHTHTNTQTHKHTNTQTHKHANTQTHRHTDTQTHKHQHTLTQVTAHSKPLCLVHPTLHLQFLKPDHHLKPFPRSLHYINHKLPVTSNRPGSHIQTLAGLHLFRIF